MPNGLVHHSPEEDTDDELRAKAAVVELLTHPEEVGEQLASASAASADDGGGRNSVSLAWIRALVEAATHGDIGTAAHQQQQHEQLVQQHTQHAHQEMQRAEQLGRPAAGDEGAGESSSGCGAGGPQ
jgi:hypothetical protein